MDARHQRRPPCLCSVGSGVSEDETGLIYMRARYMDPALGRFISEDPSRDGVNWFVYCGSNPVNLGDRTGRFPHLLFGIALAGVISGGINMIGSDDPVKSFLTGFFAGAGTAAGALAGPYAGAIVGGVICTAMAYLGGARGTALLPALFCGIVAGAGGGAISTDYLLSPFGLVDDVTIKIYGYQAFIGIVAGCGENMSREASRL